MKLLGHIKKSLQYLVNVVWASLRAVFGWVSTFLGFLNALCERYLQIMFNHQEEMEKKNNRQDNKYRFMALSNILIGITVFVLVGFVIYKSLFMVPVGNSAVILRLGQFHREVGPGLHVRLPFAEKYFVVNTGSFMHETFGFVQVLPPRQTFRTSHQEEGFVKMKEGNHSITRDRQGEIFIRKRRC